MCAVGVYAVSYATPYRGGGHIHTTNYARMTGVAQAPVASMGSTSSYYSGRGITTSTMTSAPQVRGMYTSASAIRGGVTTAETYGSQCAPRRIGGHPGECPHCIDEDGDDICDICGHDIYACECDPCHCDVPLTGGKGVWMFMAALAVVYTVYKNVKKEEKTQAI